MNWTLQSLVDLFLWVSLYEAFGHPTGAHAGISAVLKVVVDDVEPGELW